MKLSKYDKQELSRNEKKVVKLCKKRFMKTVDYDLRKILHELAETIRNLHGYSGGTAGDRFLLIQQCHYKKESGRGDMKEGVLC